MSTIASCGLEQLMAHPENSGSARIHSFMADMFCHEPAGIFKDFAIGLKPSGLRLKYREMIRETLQAETVIVVESIGKQVQL